MTNLHSIISRNLYVSALFSIILVWGISAPPAIAQSIDTPARHALLMDAQTGAVLYEKDADVSFPPASMSKMMTTYVAFEMIKSGAFSLEDTTTISAETWRNWRGQGSTMFLNAGEEVTIADLLRGIIVQSGNDACVALAEAMAGSEAAFVDWMNAMAEEMGMTGSHFVNSNGWPAEGHVMTARDLAILAQHLVNDYPDLYAIYAERSFTHGVDPTTGRDITQRNRNPILGRVEGADGLKTGHTEESGYSLTASAIREGRRLVLVVAGLDSERARARESQRLMEYGFRNFKTYDLFSAGQVVEEAEVWLGDAPKVPLVVAEDLSITMSRFDRNRMTATLVYENPLPAPIQAGQALAHVRIEIPNRDPITVPLVAGRDVDNLGGLGKISAAFAHLLFGSAN